MSVWKSYKTLKEYRKDPLAFIVNMQKLNGHRTHLTIFGRELFIISAPEDVLHVLKTNNSFYSKGRTTKALQKILGNGLITNDDMESWRKQHRLVRPIMSIKSVYDLAPKILQTVEEFMPVINESRETDAFHEMNRLTWRIILKTLFSQEVTDEMDEWLKDILQLMKIVTGQTRSTIPIPFWMPTKKNRILKRILKRFDGYVYKLISARRNGEKRQDFLQLLVSAQEDGLKKMTDLEIRDEILTFMMAGHETITNSLSWALIELAKNKKYRIHLEEEANNFFIQKDFEKLNDSPWISAVIDEVMRLWPPVWVFMRQAEKQDSINGVTVPIGANVVLATYLSHRSKDLWERPDEFFPERFLTEAKKKIPQGAFYPFGLGPRACIGAYFAGLEAKIVLSTIIHHFDWDIVQEELQTSAAEITLRPTSNIMMKFRRMR